MKLVNGRPTKAIVEITNNEPNAIQVVFVGGALSSTKELPAGSPSWESIVRNLTSTSYNLDIEAGEKKEVAYAFVQDMQPQDVLLNIVVVATDSAGGIYSLQAANQAASIVEPPTSFFDPQMYAPPPSDCH